ncbi:MAG: L-cystine uptake protein TcyP (sodium:dicarboxylate symporter family) [Oceanicoccus sp.]|jgi:L-cystine uptake protein TcyP (sodium:dicarboxylate symporter family)
MTLFGVLNLFIFLGFLCFLFLWSKKNVSLSRQVLIGLISGAVFGLFLKIAYDGDENTLTQTLAWTNIVGGIYVNLLRMIIMPLILVTMIMAVLRVEEIKSLGKIGGSVIALLIVTTMIAALVGIAMAVSFDLTSEGLVSGSQELARSKVLLLRQENVNQINMPDLITGFFSTNIFADLAGTRDTSVISVVVFAMFFGVAALLVLEENPTQGEKIKGFVEAVQAVIMRLVKLVLGLTPYGILSLMTDVVASSDGQAILTLFRFIAASYVAIALMFVVHGLMIVMFTRARLTDYVRKVWPVLTFAFVTRSSAATIPLTIKTQIEDLNVPAPIANIAASFGSTIGQNGCAGIYPAMLAIMVAPSVGINPMELEFIVSLVLVVAISSFGIAGVGGGATYAALVVLPAMGLPVTIVALLISIEPLIDMARTALNVNGAITTGLITQRIVERESPSIDTNFRKQRLP